MAEEEKEELEEEKEEGESSLIKKFLLFAIVIIFFALVYLYMHLNRLNRDLDYLMSKYVYEAEEQASQAVLGWGSEEFDMVMTQLRDVTGWRVDINEMEVKLVPEGEGETEPGYGFRYGAEMGSAEVDKIYENTRVLLEDMEFMLDKELVEDLELPFVTFVKYSRNDISCTIVKLDIVETEASEIEIGCYEVAE